MFLIPAKLKVCVEENEGVVYWEHSLGNKETKCKKENDGSGLTFSPLERKFTHAPEFLKYRVIVFSSRTTCGSDVFWDNIVYPDKSVEEAGNKTRRAKNEDEEITKPVGDKSTKVESN